ncbi:MAG TPA: Rv3235 family protein [Actinomycetes bacterium]|nr:Rv3235 family protein [Actinomycetes bacterium]
MQLPLEYCLPNGLSATPQIPQRLREGSQPSIVPWVARLAQAVLEVVAAERPVTQLTTWVLPEIYRRLDRRQQVSARQLMPGRPKERSAELVRSVHVCHPVPEVAEVSVVTVGSHDRCRALALRLERRRGRWICTELDWA